MRKNNRSERKFKERKLKCYGHLYRIWENVLTKQTFSYFVYRNQKIKWFQEVEKDLQLI